MISKREKGFTLVELLVVIAIIALLVSILLPTLSRAKELAKRASCSANLHSLGRSVYMYANTFRDFIPTFIDGPTDFSPYTVGYKYNEEAPARTYGNSRGWFALVKKGYVSLGAFGCPSDGKFNKDNYELTGVHDFRPFAGMAPISYSLQVTKKWAGGVSGVALTTSGNSGVVIAADRNGFTKWKTLLDTMSDVDRDTSVLWENSTKINSANHGRDGQNVLRLDSSVAWEKSALCGYNKDCIWTAANNTELGDPNVLAGRTRDTEDSYLMP